MRNNLINFNKVEKIYRNSKEHVKLFYGKVIIWGKRIVTIISCFGSGFWVNEKPWTNNIGWKNHN